MRYFYDFMNRLTEAASPKYDWDLNGNLIGVKDGQTTWNYMDDFRHSC